jgi:hypothetical protein
MSSGYLTTNGMDLSNVFMSSGPGIFTGVINTNAGIIGPPTSITYSSGMIGYTVTVTASSSVNPISGTYISLISDGFTIPIGVFIVRACYSCSYSSSGNLAFVNLGISESSTLQGSYGFIITQTGSAIMPANSTNSSISGMATNILVNTSSRKYYLLLLINSDISGIATIANQCYVSYTRIA